MARVWHAGKKALVELPPELVRNVRPVTKPEMQAALREAWRALKARREIEDELRPFVPGAGELRDREFWDDAAAYMRHPSVYAMPRPEFDDLTPLSLLFHLKRVIGVSNGRATAAAAKKKGRPSRFGLSEIYAAAAAKNAGRPNNQVAKILYSTKTPTPAQRRSVSTILKHHARKLESPSKK